MTVHRVGVVPWLRRRGKLCIVLVRSLDGDRWVLPKGKPKSGMSNRDLAALEGWEEAGLRGRIRPRAPIDVRLDQHGERLNLRLFPLEVRKLASRWPERRERRRRVVSARRARTLVDDDGMAAAIRELERRFG